jgi:tight adherence protein C
MLIVIAVCLFAAIALAIFAAFEQAEERATVRSSLRQLEGYEVENLRDRQMLEPVTTRVMGPAMAGLIGIGRRFSPQGYIDSTRKKLLITGNASPEDLDRFLAIRVVTVAAIPLCFVLWWFVLPLAGQTRLITFALLSLALFLGPDASLNRKITARQDLILRALPDILDLLTISVEAGLGFEQALDRTVSAVPGPLSDEFIRMLNETRAGSTRAEAMRAIDDRTDVSEVRSFVLAILQADTFGVSIGRILRSQADEMRIKRRQRAQERAMKAPVKMLLPMVFCVFPALFVVVLGPAAINITHAFAKH